LQSIMKKEYDAIENNNGLYGDNISTNNDIYIDDEIGDLDASNCDSHIVGWEAFVSKISPAKVMVVKVQLRGIDMTALIDTGASNNLIKQEMVEKLDLPIMPGQDRTLVGLGESKIRTSGSIFACVKMFRKCFNPARFDVVRTEGLKYDLFLSEEFLRKNKVIINMKKMSISLDNSDGSRDCFYVTERGDISSVIREGVPVVAAESINIGREVCPLKVNMDIDKHNVEIDRSMMCYVGDVKNKAVEGLDGILSENQDEKYVLLCGDKSLTGRQVKIKKGDCVGYINTIYEVENNEIRLTEEWSLHDIEREVDIGENNDPEQRKKIGGMLKKVQKVFGRNDMDVGCAKVPPHKIELTDDTPIWERLKQLPGPVDDEIEQQCEKLLIHDIVEHSKSSWSANIVPVRKKDGQLRICVDYRKLNNVTKPERFPMPNLVESVYSAHGMCYFTKLDCVKGYYQVELDKDSREYTAFSTKHNHYQFKRVSFGLKNSGVAFQRAMQGILSEFAYKNVIVYIDDILIMTKSFDEHMSLVEKVLTTLHTNGIKVKADKCELFKNEVEFLGHIIGKTGIRKSPQYVDKVKHYPKPATVTEMRRFLGLVNFQCKFVKDCSVIAKPLSVLTGGPKRKKIVWTQEMDEAFEMLKAKLMEDVNLVFPDYSKKAERIELFVDASGIGAGGCLRQKQEGRVRIIGYASMAFSKAQMRYSTTERELAAIRWGLRTFRPFLFGIPFVLYTDHKPLLYLNNMANDNSRLARTMNELAEYDFLIKYCPGPENVPADVMSRIVEVPTEDEIEDENICRLPDGFEVIRLVQGGGDSMFLSLMECFKDVGDKSNIDIPDSALELRKLAVDVLIADSEKFNIKLNKDKRKQLQAMKRPGAVPWEEILLVVCELYRIDIWVHHGMLTPVVYMCKRENTTTSYPILHLQCVSGLHFNPVRCMREEYKMQTLVRQKMLNFVREPEGEQENVLEDEGNDKEEMEALIYYHHIRRKCVHESSALGCGVQYGDLDFCALVDTGAEVSVMDRDMFMCLKRYDNNLVLLSSSGNVIRGIDRQSTKIVGITQCRLSILGFQMDKATTFIVVEPGDIATCCLLGADFIAQNNIVIDFWNGRLYGETGQGQWSYVIKGSIDHISKEKTAFGVEIDQNTLMVDQECPGDYDEVSHSVRFTINNEDLCVLQDKDSTLKRLKNHIRNNVPSSNWKSNGLGQFKRYASQIQIQSDLLVRSVASDVPLVSFALLIEIVYRTHVQLAHIGRGKLIDIVGRCFWHPALSSVAHDVCTTCQHCQLYKISSQVVSPPTIKIKSRYPYDLVSMDVVQFERSKRGNVAILVAVDHFSKHLAAVPIPNKSAKTVSRAFRERILPGFIRVPRRVITDNGPEFRASQMDQTMNSFSIRQLFSTRFRAQGNGAVERCNRTLGEFLKGLEAGADNWDSLLPEAIVVYNTTIHAELGECPSDFLLKNAHKVDNFLHIDHEDVSRWKEGHPMYAPFKINQRVVHKINRIGRQLKHKLGPKYEGPFRIVKIQPNKVTYEIQREGEVNGKRHKVHHRQLKAWQEPPVYLRKHLSKIDSIEKSYKEKTQLDSENDILSDESILGVPMMSGSDSSGDETEVASVGNKSTFSQIAFVDITDDSEDDQKMSHEVNEKEMSPCLKDSEHSRLRLLVLTPLQCTQDSVGCGKIDTKKYGTGDMMNQSETSVRMRMQSTPIDEYQNSGMCEEFPVSTVEQENDALLLSESERKENSHVSVFDEVNDNRIVDSNRNSVAVSPNSQKSDISNQSRYIDDSEQEIMSIVEHTHSIQENMFNLLEGAINRNKVSQEERGAAAIENLQLSEEMFEGFGEKDKCIASVKLEILNMMRRNVYCNMGRISRYRVMLESEYKSRSETNTNRDSTGGVRSPVMTRARTKRLNDYMGK